MKRALLVMGSLLGLLAVAVVVNAIVISAQTAPAEADIGRLIDVGDVTLQVREDGPAAGPPILLIHRFASSLHDWDAIVPLLVRDHRVIRTDLLGHGGSEKPSGGYTIENQARLQAGVLDALGVKHALVVGHSMGGDVGVALAGSRPDLVRRLVMISANPAWRYFTFPSAVERNRWPLLGQLQWQLGSDGMVRRSVAREFAPGYPVPERSVRDVRRMTYSSYVDSLAGFQDYLDAEPLNERAAALPMPVLVIWGSRDQLVDARALDDYRGEASVRIAVVPGVGHSAMVERPRRTAQLIRGFETGESAGHSAISGRQSQSRGRSATTAK